MANETKQPDSLDLQTNLSGAVTAVDEGVDAHGGDWLTAISNNANSLCRVSFPTPTGPPTTGAGLQTFRFWVRLTPNGTSCSYSIYVCEGGTRLNGGSAIGSGTMTSTSGEEVNATWDATLLGTSDGSAVQAEIEVVKSGGAPGARTTGEVDAVEWVVDYTVAGNNYNESISLTGTSALAQSNVVAFNPAALACSATASLGQGETVSMQEAFTLATTAGLTVAEFQEMTETLALSAAGALSSAGGMAFSDSISLVGVSAITSDAWKVIAGTVALTAATGLSADNTANLIKLVNITATSALDATAANALATQAIVASATAAVSGSGGMILSEGVTVGSAAGLTAAEVLQAFGGVSLAATGSLEVGSTAVYNVAFTLTSTGLLTAAYQYVPVGGPSFVVYTYQIGILED